MSESSAGGIDKATESRAGWWWPELLAVALPILFSIGALGTSKPLPPDSVVLGFLQYDQPSYYACAREVFENGNIFFAGSPWSDSPNSPRIYTNLTFSLFGLLWKCGLSFPIMDRAVRLVFGATMMLLLVQIMRAVLPHRRLVLPVCIILLACSGMAWAFALWRFVTDTLFNLGVEGIDFSWKSFAARFPGLQYDLERGYADWHQSIFRSLTYAPEVFYHALFFSCMLSLARRVWAGAIGFLFLAWWAHPFTGIEAGAIACLFTCVEGWCLKRIPRWPFAAACAVNVAFLAYYGAWLPRFSEHVSVAAQVRAFGNPMLFSMLAPAYGLFLVVAVLFLCTRGAWWSLRGSAGARLMLCWLVCVAVLVFHDRIFLFMKPIQPMHFTRGYLFVPLVYWSALGVEKFARRVFSTRPWGFGAICTLMIAAHLPDDWFALKRQRLMNADPEGVFYRPAECMAFYGRLDEINQPQVLQSALAIPMWPKFDYLIPVFTKHRTVVGHWANTPEIESKQASLLALELHPSRENVLRSGLTGIITDDMGVARLMEFLDEDEMRFVIQLGKQRCIGFHLYSDGAYGSSDAKSAVPGNAKP